MASNSGPDKANGYRPGQAIGHGRKLSLRIPRDRLGNFQPVLKLYTDKEYAVPLE